MRWLIVVIAWLTAMGWGCAPSAAPLSATSVAGQPEVAPVRNEWAPGLIDDGGMFQNEAAFRRYLAGSEVAAIGVLDSWDGRSGVLRVERLLRGRAGETLPLLYSGGMVRPMVGRRVVALLSSRDGRRELHSFCAASGVYELTEPLRVYLEGELGGNRKVAASN